MPIHHTPTLKVAIWVSKFVKNIIKGRTTDRAKVGQKRKAKVPRETTITNTNSEIQTPTKNLGTTKKESGATSARGSILETLLFALDAISQGVFLQIHQKKESLLQLWGRGAHES